MNSKIIDSLLVKGYINTSQRNLLDGIYSKKIFSFFYEIRTLLYLGVLTLSTGVGILIYQNIDSIGHGFIIAAIALCTAACFYYVIKNKPSFSLGEVQSPGSLFDYTLLLGCLLFLALESYIQFQYNVFGSRYGLAVFIPSVLFLMLAYAFDHKGVLSLGITGLGSWAGLTVRPVGVWNNLDFFNSSDIITTGILFGIFLILIAAVFHNKNIKRHFTYTYLNFGFNLLFISTLSGLFTLHQDILYFPLLVVASVLSIWYAKKTQSFLFLFIGSISLYIGTTYILFELMEGDYFNSFFAIIYFMVSCAGLIKFLFSYKKILDK